MQLSYSSDYITACASALWKLLFDLLYTLFDVICLYVYITYVLTYVVHASYLALLLCFLCRLCSKLQILSPCLLPVISNKWICICARKHLAGCRQRQLPYSLPSYLLLLASCLCSVRIISSISQHISCINQVLPFWFLKPSWDETSSKHMGGTWRTFSLAPEVLFGFIPSHTFSHHQAHARMILVKRGDAAQLLQGFQCLVFGDFYRLCQWSIFCITSYLTTSRSRVATTDL